MSQRNLPLLIVCLFASTLLFAQKNEMSFSIGGMFTSDQHTSGTFPCPPAPCVTTLNVFFHTDPGVTFEVTYARQIINFGPASLYVELPVLGVPRRDVPTSFTESTSTGSGTSPGFSASSVFFTPSAKVKFLESARVSPFATLGGGFAHANANLNTFFGNFPGGTSSNVGALQFGGGADFKGPMPRLGFRVEVRDFYSGSGLHTSNPLAAQIAPTHLHHVFAGGGVFLRL